MKRALFILVAAALLAPSAALATTYPHAVEAPTLEAKLPTPARVYCTQNTGYNFAMIRDREIYLGVDTCHALLDEEPSLDGHGWLTWAWYAKALYHEWWHVAFKETNEGQTVCGAEAVYRYALRTFWGFSARRAQAFYNVAVMYSPYDPVPCKPTAVDPLIG